jgi:hypothetical protein
MNKFLWTGVSMVLAPLVGCTRAMQFTPDYGVVAEYGVFDTGWAGPYDLEGQVVNAETSEPIDGIQISFLDDVTTTDGDGNFAMVAEGSCWDTCELLAEDLDANENGGHFDDATLNLEGNQETHHDLAIEMEPKDDS